jgi:hypothetical protein
MRQSKRVQRMMRRDRYCGAPPKLARFGPPEIGNTDQAGQFNSSGFTGLLMGLVSASHVDY